MEQKAAVFFGSGCKMVKGIYKADNLNFKQKCTKKHKMQNEIVNPDQSLSRCDYSM